MRSSQSRTYSCIKTSSSYRLILKFWNIARAKHKKRIHVIEKLHLIRLISFFVYSKSSLQLCLEGDILAK